MTGRTLVHTVEADDLAWLKDCADVENCSVGEIVRRCIVFTRQAAEDEANAEPSQPSEFVDRIEEYAETEPRAEEVEVPVDRDDAPVIAAPVQPTALARRPKPVAVAPSHPRIPPSLLDSTALAGGPTPRPGNATRPVGANTTVAYGRQAGDGRGNVLRANMKHLPGFGLGGPN